MMAAAVADDPLSMMAAAEDPLGASGSGSTPTAAFSSVSSVLMGTGLADHAPASRFLTWKQRRADILKQYAVAGQIKIQSDLLNVDGVAAASLGSNLDDGAKAAEKKVDMLDAKTRGRLEQLEQAENSADESRVVRLTQQELVTRVDKLNMELGKAWEAEERVRALKIAIQVSKMLGDTNFPQFYPTVFVLVTEMLDNFGELVYERVHAKGEAPGKKLRPDFAPSDVLEEGVETTKNWFYKVASIRELVPRFYVELAILKCYRLLLPAPQIVGNVRRMIQMVRGMGEPLCATYARSYLVHKILQVMPYAGWGSTELVKDVHEPLWDTFYVLKQQLASEAFLKSVTSRASLSPTEYFSTLVPALEWLMQCAAEQDGREEMLGQMIRSYRTNCKSTLVLNAVLGAFDPALVSKNALAMCDLIREADDAAFPRCALYVTLGRAICAHPPPKAEQLQVLNDVWAEIANLKKPKDYLSVALQYLRFLLLEFSHVEVSKMLRDILRRVTPEKAYLEMMPLMQRCVSSLLELTSDLSQLYQMEPFVKLLALFDGEAAKNNNQMIMDAFSKMAGTYSDPVLLNNLMHVARQLHDSLDYLSFDDERRQLGLLITAFIRKMSFGRDLEAHLSFYVDCRANFANLDAVLDTLVMGATKLAMQAHSIVHGRHSKRTAAFVKACMAFAFITIPSINSLMLRLNLYLLCAQASLCNQLLPQMDGFVKAVVTLVPEVLGSPDAELDGSLKQEAEKREEVLVSLLSNLCSFLVIVPGHPEHGPFYLVTGLLNVLQAAAWRRPASLPTLSLRILALLSTYAQRQLPYRVVGVDSNDVLYAAEPAYARELKALSAQVLQTLLKQLAALGEKTDGQARRAQAAGAAQLFELMVSNAALEHEQVLLAERVFLMAWRSGTADKAHLRKAAAVVGRLARSEGKGYKELAQRLDAVM
eukprot:Transcript_2467.p1 GENE.Transcript_2467~~Transcript_2467.p1  ORF type:complete len:958 (-),score=551.03 Transcript_2467:62-2863(-)